LEYQELDLLDRKSDDQFARRRKDYDRNRDYAAFLGLEAPPEHFPEWNKRIPLKLFLTVRSPALVEIVPCTSDAVFHEHYGVTQTQLATLVEKGFVVPYVDRFQYFRTLPEDELEKYRGILERVHINTGSIGQFDPLCPEIRSFYYVNTPPPVREKAHLQAQTVLSAGVSHVETGGYGLTLDQLKRDLAASFLLAPSLGYDNVTDRVFNALFYRKLLNGTDAGTYLNILVNMHTYSNFPLSLTYDELEFFLNINRTLNVWSTTSFPTGHEIFSTDLALTLVDLGYEFDRSKLAVFYPQLDFDSYLSLLNETGKFIRKIYDERWKLVTAQKISETVEAVVASKGQDEIEFKSILESADKSSARVSCAGGLGIRFGAGLTVTTLLSSIPQVGALVDALALLMSSYSGFSAPLLNPMIRFSLGFLPSEAAKKRLISAFNNVMKKPWARLYFKVHRRDLPSNLRAAIRDIWLVSRS